MFIKFKSFFIKLYEAIKEKVVRGYMFVSGKFKRIGNSVIDTTTGEIIEEIKPKYIGKALKNFIVDTLCADVLYEKPTTIKGRIIRGLSVFGTIGLLAAAIIAIEGISISSLLMLKVIVLLYLILVILKFTFYMYSFSGKGRCNIPVEPIEGEVLAITYDEAVASSKETLAPEEKLQAGLEALAIFVAKYSSKGSLVTADIMYMSFVCDHNTLPQGYKAKLHSFFLKHQEELVAISLKVEGKELIPLKQYRSFCKERMFTKDSTYSKAKYSPEFYEMVKNSKF